MVKNYYTLSFDVGTKNLAYSLCNYKKDNIQNIDNKSKMNLLNFKILDWNIFDIHHICLKCKQIKNKRAICNKKCSDYTLKQNTDNKNDHLNIENIEGYCKIHAKKLRDENNQQNKKNTQIKNKIIQLNKKSEKINDITILNQINTSDEFKLNDTKTIYKVSNNELFGDSLNDTSHKMIDRFDELFEKILQGYEYNIETKKINKIKNLRILIENQPPNKRHGMKSVSVLIYMYFQMKKKQYPNIIGRVSFINAITKTNNTFIKDMYYTLGIKSSINTFLEYGKRKTFAEDIIKQFVFKICTIDSMMALKVGEFLIRKKKDDLADSMLYVIREYFYNIN
jgi:hypothetical protein